jgi:hypothetical protein
MDNDDDNESDSSFIMMHRLYYEKKHSIQNRDENQQQQQTEQLNNIDFNLYEDLVTCDSVFEHYLTENSLKYSNLNKTSNYESEHITDLDDDNQQLIDEDERNLSKIVSIRTLRGMPIIFI